MLPMMVARDLGKLFVTIPTSIEDGKSNRCRRHAGDTHEADGPDGIGGAGGHGGGAVNGITVVGLVIDLHIHGRPDESV